MGFLICWVGLVCVGAHRASRNPPRRPCVLEIVSPGDAVDVEGFACKVEAGYKAALHSFKVDFGKRDASTGDELFFVHAFSRHRDFGASECLGQSES